MQKVLIVVIALLCTVIKSNAQTTKDLIVGKVHTLHSEILGEDRTLNIYLPANYDSNKNYPAIYLLDGGVDEDFIHVMGLVQFNTFPWIKRIPECVLIGIANTNREKDFTFPSKHKNDVKIAPENGGSEAFISFIEKELQPYIRKQYSVDDKATIIGQSLGGLLATEILLKQPQLFDEYIIISPSLWWNNGSLLKESLNTLIAYSSGIKVYVGVGKEGVVTDTKRVMEDDAKALAERLGKATPGLLIFDYMPEENHATAGHSGVFNAFRKLYPAKN